MSPFFVLFLFGVGGVLAGVVRLEAAARRLWARWRGDVRGAAIFAQLGGVADDLWGGRPAAARRRLERVVRGGDPRQAACGLAPRTR